jgi:ABC-2 type transport system permease protein
MSTTYKQSGALWAITRASFTAIFRNPTAIVFSILFPIIFILIFGAFGNGVATSYKIAMAKDADTTNAFYLDLKNNPLIRIADYPDSASLEKDLIRGRLTAVVDIKEFKDSIGQTRYLINTSTTTASNNTFFAFRQVLDYAKLKFESAVTLGKNEIVKIAPPQIEQVRKYRQIDFILPGQLGFSILFSTLFGIAFLFYGLREQLVLKRFYASPVNRINILLGIGMSRLFFQLMNVIILIGFGHFFLNFTLNNGFITFLEMIVLSIIMLFLLMGVGLIFSSIVKSDASIPLLINLFGFPQILLSGTFFSIEVFPQWLQKICYLLPLTQFNDAMRKLSFEGLHLYDCWEQIGILGIWIIIIYIIMLRVLKWE